ncbi:membrane dipeptidase [Lysobacter sp. SG-8]|uniref:Membrane dipeptidase n=1 Tax=Marilutibacter penaei TaxID=2759900 RepID=A0A7W3YE47_9GAMM|nr:dipeptidase [Lysobacter penaei]MBB1088038.1 membrane dipeptidase [Lysobacter penaei]
MRKTMVVPLVLTLGGLGATPSPAATPEALALARDAVIVDTHIDAPGQLMSHWAELATDASDREFDYPRARAGGLDVAFMSIYTSPGQDEDDSAWEVANKMIDGVEALVQRHPDKFALLTSPGDVGRLREGGRVLLPLGMENGAPIGEDIGNLGFFFERGVRYITLVHSANNAMGDSSYQRIKRWNGLSPLGRQAVAEMNRLGMMVDVSHLSDETVEDVLELSTVPVVATHSAFRHFTPGLERNISDALARRVAEGGGVIQIPFGNGFIDPASAKDLQGYFTAYDAFLAENARRTEAGEPLLDEAAFDAKWDAEHPHRTVPLDTVLDHIDHGVKLLGIDHVGIGSDFDGVGGNLPTGLKTVADYPNLVAGLQARGYAEADIRKLLGGNLLRVWQAVEAGAQR